MPQDYSVEAMHDLRRQKPNMATQGTDDDDSRHNHADHGMDPLSITASVIGVSLAAPKLIKGARAVKNIKYVDAQRGDIRDSLAVVSGISESLESQAREHQVKAGASVRRDHEATSIPPPHGNQRIDVEKIALASSTRFRAVDGQFTARSAPTSKRSKLIGVFRDANIKKEFQDELYHAKTLADLHLLPETCKSL